MTSEDDKYSPIMNPASQPSRNGEIELKRAGILSLGYDPATEKYVVGKDGHKPNIRHHHGKLVELAFSELVTIEENTTLDVGYLWFPDDSKAMKVFSQTSSWIEFPLGGNNP